VARGSFVHALNDVALIAAGVALLGAVVALTLLPARAETEAGAGITRERRRLKVPMARFYVGILSGIAGVLIGGWLVVAPFALAFQPQHGAWVDATKVDVFTGLGIVALGLVTVFGFTGGLVAALRAENQVKGAPPRRAQEEESPDRSQPPAHAA
jgi:heme A synthase